jgi:hypothetical protein
LLPFLIDARFFLNLGEIQAFQANKSLCASFQAGVTRYITPRSPQPLKYGSTNTMLFSFPDNFMASSSPRKTDGQRPRPLHVSKSFSRLEPSSSGSSTRGQRANTIPNDMLPDGGKNADNVKPRSRSDVFDKSSGEEDEDEQDSAEETSGKLPADFDELPIELVSLSDRSVNLIFALDSHTYEMIALLTPYLRKSIRPHQQLTSSQVCFKTFTFWPQITSTHIYRHYPRDGTDRAHPHLPHLHGPQLLVKSDRKRHPSAARKGQGLVMSERTLISKCSL